LIGFYQSFLLKLLDRSGNEDQTNLEGRKALRPYMVQSLGELIEEKVE
jgi:hypothetical protein